MHFNSLHPSARAYVSKNGISAENWLAYDFWTHHIQLHVFTMSNYDRQILEPRVPAAYVLFWLQCYSTSRRGKLCPFPQCCKSSRLTLDRNDADLWCSGRFLCHSLLKNPAMFLSVLTIIHLSYQIELKKPTINRYADRWAELQSHW